MERRRDARKNWYNKVVPVSTTADFLLSDVEATLQRRVVEIAHDRPLDLALTVWLFGKDSIQRPVPEILQSIRATVASPIRTYREVAALGYLLASGISDEPSLAAFRHGAEWLCGCSAFIENAPVGFATDAIALLGVALGSANAKSDAIAQRIKNWLAGFVGRLFLFENVDEYQRTMIVAALSIIGGDIPAITFSPTCADIRVALAGKNISLSPNLDQDSYDTLDNAMSKPALDISIEKACLRLFALQWLRRSTPRIVPQHIDVAQVTSLLKAVPTGLRRWTWEDKPKTRGGQARKWHIDHEYHVQSILWLLLAPVFPDLTYEEFTPIIGTYQPRSDIAIPSLKLILEAKFWRAGTSSKEIIEGISADIGLYFIEGSRYSQVLPVIWDDGRRTEEHHLIQTGLGKLDRVVGSVIIPRPGNMTI
jgi:hypothetical protein